MSWGIAQRLVMGHWRTAARRHFAKKNIPLDISDPFMTSLRQEIWVVNKRLAVAYSDVPRLIMKGLRLAEPAQTGFQYTNHQSYNYS